MVHIFFDQDGRDTGLEVADFVPEDSSSDSNLSDTDSQLLMTSWECYVTDFGMNDHKAGGSAKTLGNKFGESSLTPAEQSDIYFERKCGGVQ